RWPAETLPGLPPFQGGAAGLFGYELCHHLERLPQPLVDEFAVPDLAVGLYDWVIAFDHAAHRAWLISTGLPETMPVRRQRRAAALRARRRGRGRDEADQGHPPARRNARGRPPAGRGAFALGQGPGRERHDYRPVAQRPWSGVYLRLGARRGGVPIGELS